MRRTPERSIKNYLAGATITFGVVLIVTQIVALYLAGLNEEEAISLDFIRFDLFVVFNFLGSALGSFFVARKMGESYIRVGAVTAICSYIIEAVYFFFFEEGPSLNVWAVASLIIGGVIGALFAKAQNEKRRRTESKTEALPMFVESQSVDR